MVVNMLDITATQLVAACFVPYVMMPRAESVADKTLWPETVPTLASYIQHAASWTWMVVLLAMLRSVRLVPCNNFFVHFMHFSKLFLAVNKVGTSVKVDTSHQLACLICHSS